MQKKLSGKLDENEEVEVEKTEEEEEEVGIVSPDNYIKQVSYTKLI